MRICLCIQYRKLVSEMHTEIEIETSYIPLGQLLKLANVFDSGGMIKHFLQTEGVLLNDEREHRRGKKCYPGDVISIEDIGTFVVKEQ